MVLCRVGEAYCFFSSSAANSFSEPNKLPSPFGEETKKIYYIFFKLCDFWAWIILFVCFVLFCFVLWMLNVKKNFQAAKREARSAEKLHLHPLLQSLKIFLKKKYFFHWVGKEFGSAFLPKERTKKWKWKCKCKCKLPYFCLFFFCRARQRSRTKKYIIFF